MIRGRDQQMAPPVSSKAEKKTAADAAAWMFNVVTSVGIIIVNKALMASYGYTFGNQSIQPSSSLTSLVFFTYVLNPPCLHAATTLTGLHFAFTTLMTIVLRCLGYIQPSHLPFTELLRFILFANFSIVGMNVSLMWNSVGFYQVNNNNNIASQIAPSDLLIYICVPRLQSSA